MAENFIVWIQHNPNICLLTTMVLITIGLVVLYIQFDIIRFFKKQHQNLKFRSCDYTRFCFLCIILVFNIGIVGTFNLFTPYWIILILIFQFWFVIYLISLVFTNLRGWKDLITVNRVRYNGKQ